MASDYDQRISYSEKITLNESIEIKLYTTEIFLIVKINIYLFFTRYIYRILYKIKTLAHFKAKWVVIEIRHFGN